MTVSEAISIGLVSASTAPHSSSGGNENVLSSWPVFDRIVILHRWQDRIVMTSRLTTLAVSPYRDFTSASSRQNDCSHLQQPRIPSLNLMPCILGLESMFVPPQRRSCHFPRFHNARVDFNRASCDWFPTLWDGLTRISRSFRPQPLPPAHALSILFPTSKQICLPLWALISTGIIYFPQKITVT